MSNKNDSHGRDELIGRKSKALVMGGTDKIERVHSRGAMTARERITLLLDPNSFDEIGMLAHSDWPGAEEKTAGDGKITGFGTIDGRDVSVMAGDVTIAAGSTGAVGGLKGRKVYNYALEKGFPFVVLGESGGARIPDIMGSAGMMRMSGHSPARNRWIPMIATIMGECYGRPAWDVQDADISIQVKGATVAVTSPNVLGVATGETMTAEQIGGSDFHAEHTGLIDLVADNEEDCLLLIRQLLSYLPSNAGELPPSLPSTEPVDAKLDALLDIVPEDQKQVYDMHDVINLIADVGSVIELRPKYDGSLITALARIDGEVVGILANNPIVTAGAMSHRACEKGTAFLTLCDSYHIPLVFLHDTPGFLASVEEEENKLALKIITFLNALEQTTVPKITMIVRKSYGMAHLNMGGASMGTDVIMAWPTAEVSFMAPEAALAAVYGRKLDALDTEQRLKAETEYLQELSAACAPWDAAGVAEIDKIIDPRDTRKEIITSLKRARGKDGKGAKSQRNLANWPTMF